MYACKRRQRNFRRIRESTRPNQATNPSKRHRERLNGELETVAALLPFDDATIQRLDKLSVLRLAVSFVQIKAHFALFIKHQHAGSEHVQLASLASPNAIFSALASFSLPIGPIPTLINPPTGLPAYDLTESGFSQLVLKAMGGFVIALTEWGDLYYVSENIDQYLGFCQSDVLHQPITDLLHSEDRGNILKKLKVQRPKFKNSMENPAKVEYDSLERVVVGRFRCLLDNTCGFIRMEIRGRFVPLSALASPADELVNARDRAKFVQTPYALVAVCTPFVPPVHLESAIEDPILKTKHALDLGFLSIDARLQVILEIDDVLKPSGSSFYQFIHPDDAQCLSECHEETRKNGSSALLVLRIVATKSRLVYYFQSSFRLFYKSGKAESIGITHRYLTETDGVSLLEKRGSIKGSAFTHDEPSLQSPRNLSTAHNLPLMSVKEEPVPTASKKDPTALNSSKSSLRKTSTDKVKQETASEQPPHKKPKDMLPPLQLPSTSALGAISCLEELVKASTSSLATASSSSSKDKEPKASKKKQAAAPPPADALHVFNPYLQTHDFYPQHPSYPCPTWPMDPSYTPQPSVDFSTYYHPQASTSAAVNHYSQPHHDYSLQQWRADPNYLFSDYYSAAGIQNGVYPEAKGHDAAGLVGPPQLLPLLHEPCHTFEVHQPSQQHGGQQNLFMNNQLHLPGLNSFQNLDKDQSPAPNNTNFTFFNVAHTLFGQ